MSAEETAEAIILVIKRLAKWVAYGVLGIVGVGAFIAVSVWGYERYSKISIEQFRPQVVSSLKGIGIGDRWSDVVFRHGEFFVQEKAKVRVYEDGVDYLNKEKNIFVTVRNGVVFTVAYGCQEDRGSTDLNGVHCGASGDDILKQFGSKVRVLCRTTDDETKMYARVYDVVEFGTRYHLYTNKVDALIVADKEELRAMVGFNWDLCK